MICSSNKHKEALIKKLIWLFGARLCKDIVPKIAADCVVLMRGSALSYASLGTKTKRSFSLLFFKRRCSSFRRPTHLVLSWSLSARIKMEHFCLLEDDAVTCNQQHIISTHYIYISRSYCILYKKILILLVPNKKDVVEQHKKKIDNMYII